MSSKERQQLELNFGQNALVRISIHAYLTGKRAGARVVYIDPKNPLHCGIALGTLIPRIAIGAGPAGGEAQPVANNASLSSLTLSEAAELVHSKKIPPVELTKACLGRIEQLNPKLNAFITVTADSALVDARAAEAEI